MFGVAPCPTTIFTLSLLMLATPPIAKYLLMIPLLWAVIGGSAAWLLAVSEDLGLWVAAVAAVLVVFFRDRHYQQAQ